MDFAKRRLLWSLMRTPEVVQGELFLYRLQAVEVPRSLGNCRFSNVLAGSLAAKAKPPAAALGYLTTLREPVQEKDSSLALAVVGRRFLGSSIGSRLWWRVGIPVVAGLVTAVVAVVVVLVVVAAAGFGDGGITAGSLAAKGMSLAAITGHGAWVIGGLQSLGAAGLTASKAFLVWSTGTALVSMMINGSANEDKKEKRRRETEREIISPAEDDSSLVVCMAACSTFAQTTLGRHLLWPSTWGISMVYILVAMAGGGLLVYLGVALGFERAAFGRNTRSAFGNFYNRIHHGGGVYPPAILNRRHRGGRGEHRWYSRAARMPRPQVTFVHLHAHPNPHQGYL
ncbi:hypothetical protein C0Q70_09573 [Pomacea canaliculata]|uniref:Uncharacterized protein n=1 Tax=Pomacea canaliculata TaxID=400727 RepID=A0A2T7PA68_POMCA|nr:hypothetical protein C0Q70_09573 [Pomacea canaliculata]